MRKRKRHLRGRENELPEISYQRKGNRKRIGRRSQCHMDSDMCHPIIIINLMKKLYRYHTTLFRHPSPKTYPRFHVLPSRGGVYSIFDLYPYDLSKRMIRTRFEINYFLSYSIVWPKLLRSQKRMCAYVVLFIYALQSSFYSYHLFADAAVTTVSTFFLIRKLLRSNKNFNHRFGVF